MSEIKIVSDPTRRLGFRFISEIQDTKEAGKVSSRRFSVKLAGGGIKESVVIANGDSAPGALGDIQEMIDLLKEAQTAIERFRGGANKALEPLPEPGVMPKIGGLRVSAFDTAPSTEETF